jgi:hypothetical protein
VTIVNSDRSSVRAMRDALGLVRDLFRVRQWAAEGRYDLTGDDLLGISGPIGSGGTLH